MLRFEAKLLWLCCWPRSLISCSGHIYALSDSTLLSGRSFALMAFPISPMLSPTGGAIRRSVHKWTKVQADSGETADVGAGTPRHRSERTSRRTEASTELSSVTMNERHARHAYSSQYVTLMPATGLVQFLLSTKGLSADAM